MKNVCVRREPSPWLVFLCTLRLRSLTWGSLMTLAADCFPEHKLCLWQCLPQHTSHIAVDIDRPPVKSSFTDRSHTQRFVRDSIARSFYTLYYYYFFTTGWRRSLTINSLWSRSILWFVLRASFHVRAPKLDRSLSNYINTFYFIFPPL